MSRFRGGGGTVSYSLFTNVINVCPRREHFLLLACAPCLLFYN